MNKNQFTPCQDIALWSDQTKNRKAPDLFCLLFETAEQNRYQIDSGENTRNHVVDWVLK